MFDTKEKKQDEPTIGVKVLELIGRVSALETEVKQLKCDHSFGFEKSYGGLFGHRMYIILKCSNCGTRKDVLWSRLLTKQRKAYHDLYLVPNEWPVTAKKEKK